MTFRLDTLKGPLLNKLMLQGKYKQIPYKYIITHKSHYQEIKEHRLIRKYNIKIIIGINLNKSLFCIPIAQRGPLNPTSQKRQVPEIISHISLRQLTGHVLAQFSPYKFLIHPENVK